MTHSNDYHELETPHSLEPFKSKSLHDPTVHYHDYHDYPPEFYKAEYYGNYHKLSEDMMSPEQYYRLRVLNHDDHHLPYEPLQVHSWADNGFFYYDDHP